METETSVNEVISIPGTVWGDNCELWRAIAIYIGIDLTNGAAIRLEKDFNGGIAKFHISDKIKEQRFLSILEISQKSPGQSFFVRPDCYQSSTAHVKIIKFFKWIQSKLAPIGQPEPEWLSEFFEQSGEYEDLSLTEAQLAIVRQALKKAKYDGKVGPAAQEMHDDMGGLPKKPKPGTIGKFLEQIKNPSQRKQGPSQAKK
jgi:hypothetical protein